MVLKLIRSVLGIESSDTSRGTDVTVEAESGTDTDAAASTASGVDDTAEGDSEAAVADTDAAASTGSMTQEPPGEGAAEPAEAAGPTDGDTDDVSVSVQQVSGIGPAYAQRLEDSDIDTVEDLLEADPSDLSEETELSAKRIGRWQDRAEEM